MRPDTNSFPPDMPSPPGKSIIIGYTSGDKAFPIIGIYKQSEHTERPALNSAHPDANRFPEHTLTEIRESQDDSQLLLVYEILPGPVLAGKMMSGEAQGAVAGTTQQTLATGAADFTPDWKTLSWTDTPLDQNRKSRSVVTLPDDAFPILYDYDIDPETGASIVTTYQVVSAASAGAGSVSGGVVTTYRHIDKWRSLKTVANHSALTGISFDEQRFAAYSVPSLLDYTAYTWTSTCGAFVVPTDKLRAGDSFMVQMRTHTSFTTTKQTIEGLQLKGQSFMLGKGVSFPSGCLIDEGDVTYSGDCSGTINFSASSPTYTEYLAMIDTEQLVSGESVRLASGLYRNTELYATMP